MKTILGWVQSNVCSLDWALMEYMELVESELLAARATASAVPAEVTDLAEHAVEAAKRLRRPC